MAKCSVTLNNTQKNLLRGDLSLSDFAYELSDYYQGERDSFPDISVLTRFVNDDIIPKYFKGSYKIQDLYDFLHDTKNSFALGEAINSMLYSVDSTNPQDLPEPSYVQDPGEILRALRQDATQRLVGDEKSTEVAQEQQQIVDSSSEGLRDIDDYKHNFLKNYTGIEAYRLARFHGSNTTEVKLISKFINDVLLKSALINTDTKELVSAKQIPGVFGKEGAPIDFNLKEYRKSLLESLIQRTQLHANIDGTPTRVEYSDELLQPGKFDDTLKAIEQNVNAIKYNGENIVLSDEGKLVQLSNELKRTNDPKLQEVIDNYVDFALLADFDKLFDYYGNGVIQVADYNGEFDQYTRRYGLNKVNSLDAANVNWTEKIHNGVDLSPELYKTIIEVTPMLSFTTGQPVNDYLYPALVSQVMTRYDSKIDPRRGDRSIRRVIVDALNDPQNSFLNKNVLYTMYRKFYELPGDKVNTPFKKSSDYKVSSFADTLANYRDKSLLNTVTKTLQETKKVLYAEVGEVAREPAIIQSGTRNFNVSKINAANSIIASINKPTVEEINKIVSDYDITYGEATISYKAPGTDSVYQFTPRGATSYDKSTIMKLSHDLLGIDFEENSAHKEFLQELESRGTGGGTLAPQYITFMYDALKALQAKQMLFDPEVQATIKEKGSKAEFSGSDMLMETIRRSDFKDGSLLDIASNSVIIRTPAADRVYEWLADAENRYAGNRVKSTVLTPEGTTAAGFSTHTFFLGLPQTHQVFREYLSSVMGNDESKSPLSTNPFIKDPNLLAEWNVRAATKIGTDVKSNPSMTDLETMFYNINLGYFDKMTRAQAGAKDINPIFDITTYSDKTTNYMAAISNSFLNQKLFIDNGVAVPEDVTRRMHYDTVGAYYKAYGTNIIDTWRNIYSRVSPEALAEFDVTVATKNVSTRLSQLNELNSKFWKDSSKFQHGLSGLHAARFYADAAGEKLINWVHYQNNAKSINSSRVPIETKDSLIKYMSMFENKDRRAYDVYMNKHLISSVKELQDMGFKFDAQASRNIAQMYPNLDSKFKNEAGQVFVTAYNKEAKRAEDINPAFRKYFNDFNFVSENLLNSSVGPIFAHKGDSPFKAWITQVKRNVMATASMRKYMLGLEDGVENSTRTAFVDDFVTDLKTILGEEHPVVDMDGASLETVTQRLKTYNSLNAKYAGNGGPDHKSLFTHFDPNTGQAGLTKHAAFVMDYDMIRNSIGSDVDLDELHKKLWATDISKVDITKSSAVDVNLSHFQDEPVYYWDRTIDHDKQQAGYIYKLESIEYVGKDPLTKESIYTIKKRNLSAAPDQILTENNQRIRTMYDLWKVLGGIDSVDATDSATAISYSSNNKNSYFTSSMTSAQKLLNYECYIGDANERMLPAEYINARSNNDVKAWNTYSKLFNTEGVVNSHISLIREFLAKDPTKFETQTEMSDRIHDHDIKVEAPEFLRAIHENKDILNGFFNRITDKFAAKEGRVAFDPMDEVKYQRFKGKNIDRLSFAGAQKVGQYQMNDTSVLSKRKLAEFNITPEGALTNNHQVGDTVLFNGKQHTITEILPQDDKGYMLDADTNDVEHDSGIGVTGHSLYTIQDANGKKEIVSDGEIQSTKQPILPKIAGITEILTHPISNLNGGVQLNAWHEAEDSTVTAPTQMLNALIFNGKSIEDASDIYKAIGDIVDTNLTYAMQDPDILGKQKINIPQMVRGLSNAEFYKQNKDTLLKVFHDLLKQSVKENDFTLESLIKRTFTSANIPIDDPHVFGSAVSDLTNYFTKNGIRINFDGVFSVLAPSSGILQLHDVKGGFLPVKEGNGSISYRQLDPNKTTTLNKEDYKNWSDYQAWLTKNGKDTNAGQVIDHIGRDLKGQQVVLQYADGRTVDLSILRKGQNHLIPEASALSKVNELIDTYTGSLKDKSYTTQKPEDKLNDLKDYYEAFKNDFEELASTDKQVGHSLSLIKNDILDVDPEAEKASHIVDYLYDKFSGNATYRQFLTEKYARKGDTKNAVLSAEYELLDKLKLINKVFTGKLQKFLDDAALGSVIPSSLFRAELFEDQEAHAKMLDGLNTAKVVISRAECIAPLTAKNAFLLRDGDNISDIDEHFFRKRLNEKLDYNDVDADGLLLSKYGRKIFIHAKRPSGDFQPTKFTREIGETTWYTNESGDPLFIIPKGVAITNVGGDIHAYVKNEAAAMSLRTSANNGFSDSGDRFKMIGLRGTPEEKAAQQEKDQQDIASKAKVMWNSWQKYLEVIGTRIPGQHFQSFQGMKIVGFSGEGNKIYIPNEVTLLSGSDFDIDKQNVIYHSINRDGSLALWHPASRYDTPQHIEQSLKLPLQSRRQAEDFTVRLDGAGNRIDNTMSIDDSADLTDLNTLLGVYSRLRDGFRLDPALHPNIIDTLVKYDNMTDGAINDNPLGIEMSGLNNGVKGIKNFAISRTNSTIENPSNFIYLSKPVSMDVPALFADNSPKGEAAKNADPHKPNSIAGAKLDNMVGKKVIGIMATGLKVWSGVSLAYNNELRNMSPLVKELYRLRNTITELTAQDPIGNQLKIQELTKSRDQLNARIDSTVNALRLDNIAINKSRAEQFGVPSDLIPNLNYDKISSDVLYEFFKRIEPSPLSDIGKILTRIDSSEDGASPLLLKQYLKTRGTFEDDAAEIMSQLLSAATDNAKELILAKINASPDMAGIYAAMLMMNTPFEQIVDKMTSPLTETVLKRGAKNIYDKNTSKNTISDLLRNLVDAHADTGDAKKDAKIKDRARKTLKDRYDIVTVKSMRVVEPKGLTDPGEISNSLKNSTVQLSDALGLGFKDNETNMTFSLGEAKELQMLFDTAREVSLLGRMFSINQGVKSNTWDLYNFRAGIEDHVTKTTKQSFSFKEFLDSLASDQVYANSKIDLLSENRTAFNILYVLAKNPHFAEQLKAYNAAHTILELSSYKVKAADTIVKRLRDINYLGESSNVNEKQYKDIERFVENSIIENFIDQETAKPRSQKSSPIFYDDDKEMRLTNATNQEVFANWVRDKFIPALKANETYRGNEFIQGLTSDTKRDSLLNDKFGFVKLKMDTTNAQSPIQLGNRDNLTYGLRLLRESGATDLQHPDDVSKNNDIVNTLFWYNLILNKNNITKNSYAQMLGEVMGLTAGDDNPYRTLLEMKGNIGKNEAGDAPTQALTLVMSNGIMFDLMDLFKSYDSFIGDEGIKFKGGARRGGDEEFTVDDPLEDIPEEVDDLGDHAEADDTSDIDETADMMDMGDTDFDEDSPDRPAKIKIEKSRTLGSVGTYVKVYRDSDDRPLFEGTISSPSSLIPHDSVARSKYTFHSDYNPLIYKRDSLSDRDSMNFQKMMNLTMHDLLRNLADKLDIKVIQRSGNDVKVSDFDPTKTYDCI